MYDCIEETGKTLNLNNEGIVKYLCSIEEERRNLEIIIQKQYQERKQVESEIERLTYKLCLINKSLSMRIKAKNNYDKTIEEIKAHYEQLVDSSNKLRQIVEKTQQELDDIMNKKTGTSTGSEGMQCKMLYSKSSGDQGRDSCSCTYSEAPTKEMSQKCIPVPSKVQRSVTPPESPNNSETKTTDIPNVSSIPQVETVKASDPHLAETVITKLDVNNPLIQSLTKNLDTMSAFSGAPGETNDLRFSTISQAANKSSEKQSLKGLFKSQYSTSTTQGQLQKVLSDEEDNTLKKKNIGEILNDASATKQM